MYNDESQGESNHKSEKLSLNKVANTYYMRQEEIGAQVLITSRVSSSSSSKISFLYSMV